MTYSIAECFINELERKFTSIRKKCEKYGCSFSYQRLGYHFEDVADDEGDIHKVKFIDIQVSGVAIINNWIFVAALDHTEQGNIVRQYDDTFTVPELYYHTEPVCEHCRTIRNRSRTYVIHNVTTHEWKQVGRSCLRDFTNGLDADIVASFMSCKDLFTEYEAKYIPSRSYKHYWFKDDVLLYAKETVNHFGYVSSQADGYTTAIRCSDYYNFLESGKVNGFREREALEEDLKRIVFDPRSEQNLKYVNDLKTYILNQDCADNNYIHNLQVIMKSEYISHNEWNLLVSSIRCYDRYLEAVKETEIRERNREQELKSRYVGEIKDKIDVDIEKCNLVTSWDNQFGWSGMYKFLSKDGDVFIWITSKDIDTDNVARLHGTVKDHSEYNGIKQTVLTRCKIEKLVSP